MAFPNTSLSKEEEMPRQFPQPQQPSMANEVQNKQGASKDQAAVGRAALLGVPSRAAVEVTHPNVPMLSNITSGGKDGFSTAGRWLLR